MTKHHDGGAGGGDGHRSAGSDHHTDSGGAESHNAGIHQARHDAYSRPKAPGTNHPTEGGGGTTHPTEGGGGTTHPTEGGGPPTHPTEGGGGQPQRDNPAPHHNNHHRGGDVLYIPPVVVPFVRIEADNGPNSIIRGSDGRVQTNGRNGMTFP